MNQRHPFNQNLFLHAEPTWQGFTVYDQRGPLIQNYLERIHQVIHNAVGEYPRTWVVRCDLHFLQNGREPDSAAISRFIDSLKAQLVAHEYRKAREGKRVHPCRLRFVWVKEQAESHHPHYHVALFFNRYAYFTLGTFKQTGWGLGRDTPWTIPDPEDRNMVDRIRMAWASALDLGLEWASGLVHFPDNATYHLDAGDPAFESQFANLFQRLSYFAKAETKHFGDGTNWFGSSRG